MRIRKLAGVFAAGLIALTGVSSALAADPSDDTIISFEINEGTEFSVDITGSTNFPSRNFSLTGPPNWTDSASYNLTVTDLRGTGAGWNVMASASPFTPAVPNTGLVTGNNTVWSVPVGYTASPGSVTNGVAVTPGSADIIAAPASIIGATSGIVNAQPNGTGKFSTQEAVYYTGMPAALAAAEYSTTVTLTLSGTNP